MTRSINPGKPTPALLIPPLDPGKVATDLVTAIGEGIHNAAALVGSPPPAAPGKTTHVDVSDLAALRRDTETAGQEVSRMGPGSWRASTSAGLGGARWYRAVASDLWPLRNAFDPDHCDRK